MNMRRTRQGCSFLIPRRARLSFLRGLEVVRRKRFAVVSLSEITSAADGDGTDVAFDASVRNATTSAE